MKKYIILAVILAWFSTPVLAGKDFYKKDFRDKKPVLVKLAGQRLSHEYLTFVVHGGNKKLMMMAYGVAQRLDEEGIPIAFLLASSDLDTDKVMYVEYYANGGKKFSTIAYDNEHISTEKGETDLYEHAKKAYADGFLKETSE